MSSFGGKKKRAAAQTPAQQAGTNGFVQTLINGGVLPVFNPFAYVPGLPTSAANATPKPQTDTNTLGGATAEKRTEIGAGSPSDLGVIPEGDAGNPLLIERLRKNRAIRQSIQGGQFKTLLQQLG